MFTKILIANRGEIACRIITTAKKMGISTVAVYSDADKNSLHVTQADEAIYIGASPSRESYLVIDKVINAALATGAQAIHPGYGFLSENAEFCQACDANNIIFIGPPVAAIKAMGSKSAAKTIMEKAGVPLVPGYHGDDQNPTILKQAADDMGYPVLLKATAGGGGKGMRQVWNAAEFTSALDAAKREALNGFNDDNMLVEKYLTQPRHIEIQVFCDNFGNAVYLAERDCSVQRRHQKVIEEAPAPGMTTELRQQMGNAAIRAAHAIDYRGAGTIEFLLDVDGSFYFMEMNTRLQVEHPVTEMITGQDLVEWQLRVANNEPLPLQQAQVHINGHAFEARIYAEDPRNDFLPATGTLEFLQAPTTSDVVRVDTGVIQGDDVSVYYDPMIAKLVVWSETRESALRLLAKSLQQYLIAGVTTNIEFLHCLATHKSFEKADFDTGFIEKHQDTLQIKESAQPELIAQLGALYLNSNLTQQQKKNSDDRHSPWQNSQGWRANSENINSFDLVFAERPFAITIENKSDQTLIKTNGVSVVASATLTGNELTACVNGHNIKATVFTSGTDIYIYTADHHSRLELLLPDLGTDNLTADGGALTAPMPGTIVELLVATGQAVTAGDALLVMEAMKMEHTINAPSNGKVAEFFYQAGDLVDNNAVLLDFNAEE
ncbi:MAG: 3-methylcrotonyl-CoA carboxylase alpha subunit [Porticoccus sp.]|jgi:3-methylcrotonyl-CoA carboxylase alpha subunit